MTSREPELFTGVPVRDDAEHWNSLATRVSEATLRNARTAALERLGQSRASWLAAAMLLIAALAYLAAPRTVAATPAPDLSAALAPADDVGRAMITPSAPPSIGALMIAETRPGR